MRKELVFAILAGSILGLVIAFGIWRVNSTLPKPPGSNQSNASPSPIPSTSAITLAKIEDNDVVVSNPLSLTGLTQPLDFVAISGESSDYLTTAAQSGEFTKDVSLDAGINRLLIDAFDTQGSYSEKTVTLVFSSEFAKYLTTTPSPDESATPSADSIRDKVQQKVDQALQKPKAYIGSITDVMESTVQIKSPSGEILQLSTTPDTSFTKTVKGKTSDIKFTDLAIGDYIIGMGIQNGNKVLEANRILVTDAPGAVNRNILYGRVVKSDAKTITLETMKDKKSFVITYDKNTDFLTKKADKFTAIKIAAVNDGEDIGFIFNTVADDGTYTARTVIVLR